MAFQIPGYETLRKAIIAKWRQFRAEVDAEQIGGTTQPLRLDGLPDRADPDVDALELCGREVHLLDLL